MKELNVKNKLFVDSIIRNMTLVAKKYNAINLSQGYPEFNAPDEILERLKNIAFDDIHQYPCSYGIQSLREALAKKYEHFSGMSVNPDEEITITCGGTEAMVATMLSIINPKDKVIVFTPIYENYNTNMILVDAEPVYVPLHPENNYNFDANELEDAFKQGVKAIIVCNPSNPCGKVFNLEEMNIIANFAKKYDAYVITDEVYEHMIYEPNKMVYMSTLTDMKERTIVCSSLSKTYAITGWRIGYIIAPKKISEDIKKVHNFLTIAAPAPLQEAVLTGVKFDQSYYDELTKKYTKLMKLFCNGLDKVGIKHNKPQGTYFVMCDMREYMNKAGIKDDVEFAKLFCEKVGVCMVPTCGFWGDKIINGYFRMHFAKNEETLIKAIDRLSNINI